MPKALVIASKTLGPGGAGGIGWRVDTSDDRGARGLVQVVAGQVEQERPRPARLVEEPDELTRVRTGLGRAPDWKCGLGASLTCCLVAPRPRPIVVLLLAPVLP
ncbi:hypothetical protein [Streptomyces graminilatus]|uniref:hypothetical protein n=1 Tax=Streptomyces graminilatus TaxID=1464070 RepID=UPI0006E37C39|nr:hypothetical protein [Streptomyces graminilatus]